MFRLFFKMFCLDVDSDKNFKNFTFHTHEKKDRKEHLEYGSNLKCVETKRISSCKSCKCNFLLLLMGRNTDQTAFIFSIN